MGIARWWPERSPKVVKPRTQSNRTLVPRGRKRKEESASELTFCGHLLTSVFIRCHRHSPVASSAFSLRFSWNSFTFCSLFRRPWQLRLELLMEDNNHRGSADSLIYIPRKHRFRDANWTPSASSLGLAFYSVGRRNNSRLDRRMITSGQWLAERRGDEDNQSVIAVRYATRGQFDERG